MALLPSSRTRRFPASSTANRLSSRARKSVGLMLVSCFVYSSACFTSSGSVSSAWMEAGSTRPSSCLILLVSATTRGSVTLSRVNSGMFVPPFPGFFCRFLVLLVRVHPRSFFKLFKMFARSFKIHFCLSAGLHLGDERGGNLVNIGHRFFISCQNLIDALTKFFGAIHAFGERLNLSNIRLFLIFDLREFSQSPFYIMYVYRFVALEMIHNIAEVVECCKIQLLGRAKVLVIGEFAFVQFPTENILKCVEFFLELADLCLTLFGILTHNMQFLACGKVFLEIRDELFAILRHFIPKPSDVSIGNGVFPKEIIDRHAPQTDRDTSDCKSRKHRVDKKRCEPPRRPNRYAVEKQ